MGGHSIQTVGPNRSVDLTFAEGNSTVTCGGEERDPEGRL